MQISKVGYLPIVNNRIQKNEKEVSNVRNIAENKDCVQFSNAFYYPLNFTSSKRRTYSSDLKRLKEKSGDFQVSRFNDIPCPACGKKMINLNRYNQIANDLYVLNPEEYLDYIGQYTEYMRPVEESVYNELVNLSKTPGNSKDIRTLVVQLRDKKLPVLQKAQMKTVNKMRALARTLPADEQKVLNKKICKLVALIKRNNSEAPFRRKIVLDRISKIKIRNPYKYEKLQKIAKTFPTSADMNSAWIVKYSGKNKYNENWNSYDIALRFFSTSVANTDHIIAYDIENNHDDISNYMSMHSACNSQKGNKPFLQWLNEDKISRIRHMQDYFTKVQELIDHRRIKKKKYRNYVALATETIYEASKGQLKLFSDNDELPS